MCCLKSFVPPLPPSSRLFPVVSGSPSAVPLPESHFYPLFRSLPGPASRNLGRFAFSMDDGGDFSDESKKRAKFAEISAAPSRGEAVEEGGGAVVGDEELPEESGAAVACSEEMEARIGRIVEKIDQYTQQVAEMLEAGKTMFKNMNTEFEERMIGIHRDQIDKWEEEIKELRLLDASNEEASALLQKTRCHLLRIVQIDP